MNISIKKILVFILTLTALISLAAVDSTGKTMRAAAETAISSSPNLFDAFTDSDYLYDDASGTDLPFTIQEYKEKLFNKYAGFKYGSTGIQAAAVDDDNIVDIIPKTLFEEEGTTLHIGREYGFFIQTENTDRCFTSTAYVFDIATATDTANPDTPSQVTVTVKPLFQYKYLTLLRNNDYYISRFKINCTVTGCTYDSIVIPLPSSTTSNILYEESTEFFIKDVSFGGSIFNRQYLNYGDRSYDGNHDQGSFFTRSQLEYCGVGKEMSAAEALTPIVKFGLGAVGTILPGTGVVSGVLEIVNAIIATKDFVNDMFALDRFQTISYNDLYSQSQYVSKVEQMQYNGFLNKNTMALFESSESNPVMFGRATPDNYLRCTYTMGQTEAWSTKFFSTIGLNIVTQETDFFGKSTVTEYAAATKTSGFEVREKNVKPLYLDNYAAGYALNASRDYFSFVPLYSGKYELTVGNGLTQEIFDHTHKAVGGERRDNLLKVFLRANHVYQIECYFDNNEASGAFNLLIGVAAVEAGVSETFEIGASDNYILRFEPIEATVYKISAGLTGEVSLYVLNAELTQVEYSSTNELFYNFAGSGSYFIVVYNRSSGVRNANLTIALPELLVANTEYNRPFDGNWQYFRFKAAAAGRYVLRYGGFGSDGVQTAALPAEAVHSEMFAAAASAVVFDLGSAQEINFGIKATGSIAMKFAAEESAVGWVVDGKESGTILKIKRGDSKSIRLKVNGEFFDDYIVESYNNAGGKYSFADNKLIIDKERQLTNNLLDNPLILCVAYGNNSIAALKVYVVYDGAPAFTTYAEENNFGLCWNALTSVADETASLSGKIVLTNGVYKSFIFSNAKNGLKSTFKSFVSSILPGINDTGYMARFRAYTFLLTKITIIKSGVSSDIYINDPDRFDNITVAPLTVNQYFGGGSGTTEDPFTLSQAWHLNNIGETKNASSNFTSCFKLTGNIVSKTSYTDSWKPLYNWHGVLDGNGFSITNLYINVPAESNILTNYGIVGINYGTIENLTLIYAQARSDRGIEGAKYFGYFAGSNYGTIQNCHYRVEEEADTSFAAASGFYGGFIAGYNNGRIKNCTVDAYDFTGYGNKGGIVGCNAAGGVVEYCSFKGTIFCLYADVNSAEQFSAGGIGGVNYGNINNCINNGWISFDHLAYDSKTLQPRMGQMIGTNASSGTYSMLTLNGAVSKRELTTITWKTGIWPFQTTHTHDQALYIVNGIYGKQD